MQDTPTGPVPPVDAARTVARLARASSGGPGEVQALGALLARLIGPPAPRVREDPVGLAPPAPPTPGPPFALQLVASIATAESPAERYPDPAALAAALEAWLRAELGRAGAPAPPASRGLAAAAVLAGILGLVPLAAGLAGVVQTWEVPPTGVSFALPVAAQSAPVGEAP